MKSVDFLKYNLDTRLYASGGGSVYILGPHNQAGRVLRPLLFTSRGPLTSQNTPVASSLKHLQGENSITKQRSSHSQPQPPLSTTTSALQSLAPAVHVTCGPRSPWREAQTPGGFSNKRWAPRSQTVTPERFPRKLLYPPGVSFPLSSPLFPVFFQQQPLFHSWEL